MEATFTAEGCGDLPAGITLEGKFQAINTAWKLNTQEHAAVAATGIVILTCIGAQPPVRVGALAFEEREELEPPLWHVTSGPDEFYVRTLAEVLTLALHSAMQNLPFGFRRMN